MEVLELSPLASRSVGTLSGGERRRVALGRAICSGPYLLLMDEPLAGLDAGLRRRILPYLLRVQEEFTIPTVYVSHEATEIRMMSKEVLVLDRGRVKARGAPDEVFTRPTILPLARDEGFENVVTGRPRGGEDANGDVVTLQVEPGLCVIVPAGGVRDRNEVTAAVRAEDLILAVERPRGISARNILPGIVSEVRDTSDSDQVLVVVEVGKRPTRFVTAVTREARRQLGVNRGQMVHLVAKVHAFRVLASR
jgi:molybdate transport system ATP-binding protein